MPRHLSEFEKGEIIALFKIGKTYSNISSELGIPISTVGDVIKKWKDLGIVSRLPGSGRPSIFNQSEEELLNHLCNENSRLCAKDLRKKMIDITNKKASIRTIGSILKKVGLFGRVAKNKPLLSSANIMSRFELSKIFLRMTDDKWKTVIFSDEATFELFPSHRHQIIYRRNKEAYEPKNLVPTVKFGKAKIMVWGCISYQGVGKLVFVDGTLNSAKYINLLANNLPSSAYQMGMEEYIFQQDGAPCHTSNATKDFLTKKIFNYYPGQLSHRI